MIFVLRENKIFIFTHSLSKLFYSIDFLYELNIFLINICFALLLLVILMFSLLRMDF